MTTTTTTTTVSIHQTEQEYHHDSDDDEEPITAELGLSSETLAALLLFQQQGGCFIEEDDEENEQDNILDKDTVCVAYTEKDSQTINETFRRLRAKEQEKEELEETTTTTTKRECILRELNEPATGVSFHEELETKGVVRINGVFSDEKLRTECLNEIHRLLDKGQGEGPTTTKGYDDDDDDEQKKDGFGNVFSRDCRYDMYLTPTGIFQPTLHHLLSDSSPLGTLFHGPLLQGQAGYFHEFSSLTSDPGAASQPIHPDSPYVTPEPTLWTVFVALQDITPDMGPTTVLPGTHTKEMHDLLTNPQQSLQRKRDCLLQMEHYQCLLKAGDAIVMDSRTFHYGGANVSNKEDGGSGTRRTVLYFTIRNPIHGNDDDYFPKCNSLWPHLKYMTTINLGEQI